jgi:4-alpha-glucanotransferase
MGYALFSHDMTFDRASGILLHPTSLPGGFGIGDLGAEALKFCELLASAGQTYWQILPLGPTGYGDSPYQSFSAFAGNTLLISPETLVADGYIGEAVIDLDFTFREERVDYGAVYEWKTGLLRKAYEGYRNGADTEVREKFARFALDHAAWLDEYALYRAIKAAQGHRAWFDWPENLRLRDAEALAYERESLAEQIEAEKFYQFLFFEQWNTVKRHANDLGIKIIGDIPIFVALDSADVWSEQSQFKLKEDGSPKVVAGVPPDYFSKTGQLWGNPIYDWDAMRGDGYRWWTARVRAALAMVDVVRIDHFRGFAAAWEVPGGHRTAEKGQWVDAPGAELFATLQRGLGQLPFIVEDLGVITPDVDALRDQCGFDGTRVLQFAFGGDAANLHLPHNYVRNCAAYTGTHDNETAVGWFDSRSGPERDHCLNYLSSDASEIHWDMIRSLLVSVANTVIIPMQDILGLGNEARMNLPATTDRNWQWRLSEGSVTPNILERLRELTELYGRSVIDHGK